MSMNIEELRQIFEYELKRKLAQRSRSPQEELRKLISSFKFFDYTSSFILDKSQWIKGILKTGLCGFNINDLSIVFERYDPNKTGYINYINFSNHIYGKEELIPIASNFEKDNQNNISSNTVNNKGNISEFKPPGLYERNFDNTVKQNQLSHYNNSESLLNDFDINNNINSNKDNNINNNSNNIRNNINSNNIIEDNNISKQKNYHMSKSQSQIITPNKANNINNLKNDDSNNEDNSSNNNNIKSANNNLENKSYFQKIINLFKNQINNNNGITYYTFAHALKSLEDKNTKTISIENLYSIVDQMGLNISQDDLINFYSILDYTQSNKVPIDEILRLIKGEIPEQRKILVVSKFGIMDKEKTGIIPISLVKELFNFKFHPDAFLGKKTSEEVYKEFLYTFNIFCELKGLKDEISYKDFIDYYTPISASILNDNYFDDIIYGAWNIEDNSIIDKYNIGDNNNLKLKENNRSYNNINEENIQIEKRNNFEINNNNLSKSQNMANTNQIRVFSPNKNEENIKNQRMSPYYNPRITPEGKGLKMFRQLRFNPITNEYIMSPVTPERNINSINNQNYKNNNINNNLYTNVNSDTENNNNINNNNNYLNDNGSKKINLLRDLLAKRGQKSIFIIQRMFYIYDRNQTGQIPFDKLCDIFEIYNINITREDIFEFFNILDKEHKGIIKYNDLIQILIDNINQNREIIIQKLFEKFNKGKGFVSISDLKQNFNPLNHPDAINQLRNKDEILLDFIDSLEIFREYNSNLNNENIKNGYMSYNDFYNFFKEISISISDDKYFEYLINNCWSLNQNLEKNNFNYNNNINYGNDNVRIRAGKEIVNNF